MNTDDFYRYSFDLELLETQELGIGPYAFPYKKPNLPPIRKYLMTGIFESGEFTPINFPRKKSQIPIEGIINTTFN